MKTFAIRHSLARKAEFYAHDDERVPQELFSVRNEAPDLDGIYYALPAAKKDYFCSARTEHALWMGAPNGITRYAPSPEHEADRVMYFSYPAELEDSNVKAILADKDSESVWVLTEKSVAHISLSYISAEEKARILTEETEKYVSRRGMITNRWLGKERDPGSVFPYGASDNSGCFTAAYGIGELFKFAVYKKKYGRNDERTEKAYRSAVRTCEAAQLLMYMPGRDDGFVARDYQVPGEPLPKDSIIFRKNGDMTTVLETPLAVERGYAGEVFRSPYKVPERLAHLYKDEGCDGDGIVYRGDTSSDEITIHLLLIYFAHKIIGEEDRELDDLMVHSMKKTVKHIIDHGFMLCDYKGKPTTWARWDRAYFETPLGWSDACLNAAEMLMYLKLAMEVTGEEGIWKETYDHLVNDEGYADLAEKHEARFYISSMANGLEETEDLMYGDNMLAATAYWMLCTLEKDEKLREKYKNGLRGWNGTFRREHNPAYDIPYMLSCPEDDIIDTERLEDWFRRQSITRLMAAPDLEKRLDVTKKRCFGGTPEAGCLLPPDEFVASKYDRNPFEYLTGDKPYDLKNIESAYTYTYAYWLGRYYGIIEED